MLRSASKAITRFLTALTSSGIKGPILTSASEHYAAEISGFNTAIKHSPDVIVGAASTEDIAQSLRLAQEFGIPISVQSTGHGPCTGITSGIFISTRRLKGVKIDSTTGRATIAAGETWGSVVAEGVKQGLAPIAGSSTTVGVVGYLLGGGLGPFARSHGYSSDYVTGFKVVTAAGEVIEANAKQHPDLFWALRGGKCGLGLVTEIEVQLVNLKSFYAGSIFFEEKDIEAGLRGWAEWTKTANKLVTTSAVVVRFPPLDTFPPPLRGRRLLALRFAFPGPKEESEKLASPLRSLAPIYIDNLTELPAAEVAKIHNDPTTPGPVWSDTMLLHSINQDAITHLLQNFGPGTSSSFVAAELRHIGAATKMDVEGGSAASGRSAEFIFGVLGKNPALFETQLPREAERLRSLMAPWILPEGNINFMVRPLSSE